MKRKQDKVKGMVTSEKDKTCAICGRKVYPGTGTYYGGRLVHRSCLDIAKIQRYKLYKKKYSKRKKKKSI